MLWPWAEPQAVEVFMSESILFQAHKAEARAMVQALSALPRSRDQLREVAPELPLLIEQCARYPGEMRALWEAFHAPQPAGTTVVLRSIFEGFLELIDERLAIIEGVRSLFEDLVWMKLV